MLSLCFFLSALVLISFTDVGRNLALSVAVGSIVFFVISIAYIAIDNLTGAGLNESVLYYLRSDSNGAGLADFSSMALAIVLSSVVVVLLAITIYHLIQRDYSSVLLEAFLRIASFSCLLAAVFMHPLLVDWRDLEPVKSQSGFYESYLIPSTFEPPDKKKNLVFIYLEGLERTYLDQTVFPGLTPELNQLDSSGFSLRGIEQLWGTGWTIAGMTATQCGIPLVTTGSGGSTMYGMTKFLPRATCMGDLLSQAGYELSYIGGASLKFAGKGKFYRDHGFNRVQGRDELKTHLSKPNYMNSWGLYDDTLFDLALDEFKVLAEKEKPFALFMLTLDTHHPDGYPSDECKNRPELQFQNSTLDAVACSSFLVNRFIDNLRETQEWENTVVVLASDHLSMPNKARRRLEEADRRNLFVAIGSDIEHKIIDSPANSFDVAPTTLSLLGFTVPSLGFGRSLALEQQSLSVFYEDIDQFIRGFTSDLRKFWNFPKITDSMVVQLDKNKVRIDNQDLSFPILIKLLKVRDSAVSPGGISEIYFPGYWYVSLSDNLSEFEIDDPFIWIDSCSDIEVLSRVDYGENDRVCFISGQLGLKNLVTGKIENNATLRLQDLMFSSNLSTDDKVFGQRVSNLENKIPVTKSVPSNSEKSTNNQALALNNIAAQLYDYGNYDSAIVLSKLVTNLDSRNFVAYNNICASYNSQKKYERGIEACKKALEIRPDYSLAKNNLRWAEEKLSSR